jgi:hypothetical protein
MMLARTCGEWPRSEEGIEDTFLNENEDRDGDGEGDKGGEDEG